MKKYLIILALLASPFGFGQQDAMFTHYGFNTLGVNPAYAGSREALTTTLINRNQWLTFPGAPRSQTINLHTPIFNQKLGLGVSLSNDQIGVTRFQKGGLDLAYRLDLGKGVLAFGLNTTFGIRSVEYSDLNLVEESDDVLGGGSYSQGLLNFGSGVYYSTENFYLGLSCPRLLENSFESVSVSLSSEKRHFYFISGAVFTLNSKKTIKLKPTVYLKAVSGAPLEVDVTGLFYFHDKFWVGPMFRSTDAFGALLGVQFTDQFCLGYSFDWSFANTTGTYNNGSHELMLRYDLIFKNNKRIYSPRNF